jgi:pimeloyl-ACP methyl ester carboxylesterase
MPAEERHLELDGGRRIAWRRLPGTAPEILFLPGFRSNMAGTKAIHLEAFCRRRGLAYTRFDYSGHGASSGRFEDGTIGRWRDEAIAVIDRVCERPLILVGSSFGAWIAVLAALKRRERAKGLITLAAAADFTEDLVWSALDEAGRAAFEQGGRLVVPSAYDPEPTVFTWRLVEEARAHLVLRAPIGLRMPAHLIHGQADPDVPWQTSLTLAERLEGRAVTVELVKDGDHRLSRPEDLERLDQALERMVARIEPARRRL